MRRPKRVGSYLDYVGYLVQKTALESGFMLLTIGAFACATMAILSGVLALCFGLPLLLIFTLIMGGAAWALLLSADAAGSTSQKMETVAPPTRQQIEQLPPEETLVRASQEPTEKQEKVLLRAATATEEAKPEELLRATTER